VSRPANDAAKLMWTPDHPALPEVVAALEADVVGFEAAD